MMQAQSESQKQKQITNRYKVNHQPATKQATKLVRDSEQATDWVADYKQQSNSVGRITIDREASKVLDKHLIGLITSACFLTGSNV